MVENIAPAGVDACYFDGSNTADVLEWLGRGHRADGNKIVMFTQGREVRVPAERWIVRGSMGRLDVTTRKKFESTFGGLRG